MFLLASWGRKQQKEVATEEKRLKEVSEEARIEVRENAHVIVC